MRRLSREAWIKIGFIIAITGFVIQALVSMQFLYRWSSYDGYSYTYQNKLFWFFDIDNGLADAIQTLMMGLYALYYALPILGGIILAHHGLNGGRSKQAVMGLLFVSLVASFIYPSFFLTNWWNNGEYYYLYLLAIMVMQLAVLLAAGMALGASGSLDGRLVRWGRWLLVAAAVAYLVSSLASVGSILFPGSAAMFFSGQWYSWTIVFSLVATFVPLLVVTLVSRDLGPHRGKLMTVRTLILIAGLVLQFSWTLANYLDLFSFGHYGYDPVMYLPLALASLLTGIGIALTVQAWAQQGDGEREMYLASPT